MPPGGLVMRVRDRVGLNFPPLLLRIMLGVIFLWAGLGKIMMVTDVSGEQAAQLANLGLLTPTSTTTNPPPATPPAALPATPAPEKKDGAQGPMSGPRIILAHQASAPKTYTSADFPTPVKVRQVHGLTLALISSANPGFSAEGTAKMPLWPKALALGNWPVYMAWAATLTETIGGAALLAGFFTRFFAFSISIVMLNAMWLTQIGPAIQSGKTTLGFLPQYPTFGIEWQTLFFQFALCMAAWALLFLGPGRASLDKLLFSKPSEDDDEEAE